MILAHSLKGHRADAAIGATQPVLVGVSGRAIVCILTDQKAELGYHL